MKKIVRKKIYKPRAWTRDLHESDARWKVIVCHRRAGKTTAALGEVGLGGELRTVGQIDKRLEELNKMGVEVQDTSEGQKAIKISIDS